MPNKKIQHGAVIILFVLALVFLVYGIYLFVHPKLMHQRQETAEAQLLEAFKNVPLETDASGENCRHRVTIEVPPNIFENDDMDVPDEPSESDLLSASETESRRKTISVVADSVLRIPFLGYESCVGMDVKMSTLAVVPGHYPESSDYGRSGIAVIFGHNWIYKRPRHFSLIDHVPLGAIIEIEKDGRIYTYTVDLKKTIHVDDIAQYLYGETQQKRILLVTCYRPPKNPNGFLKHRTLLGGVLKNVRDAESGH